MKFKKITAICLSLLLLVLAATPAFATDAVAPIDADAVTEFSTDAAITLDCVSAVLMDAATGEVLVAKNENEALPPASVTKIMTLLLVMEAVDEGRVSLTDTVTVSERAAAMGGSQVFLKVGEEMSLEEDRVFYVDGAYRNEVTVQNGTVRVSHSNCPGTDCVFMQPISSPGRTLVCLPNRVEIRVVNADGTAQSDDDVDFVVR